MTAGHKALAGETLHHISIAGRVWVGQARWWRGKAKGVACVARQRTRAVLQQQACLAGNALKRAGTRARGASERVCTLHALTAQRWVATLHSARAVNAEVRGHACVALLEEVALARDAVCAVAHGTARRARLAPQAAHVPDAACLVGVERACRHALAVQQVPA